MSDILTIDDIGRLEPRAVDSHKGDFGRVLVIGGSPGMIGAPGLCANGALRGGAGLVTVATQSDIQLAVAGLCPCATSMGLGVNPIADLNGAIKNCDVLAVGPGMGVNVQKQMLVGAVLGAGKPVVLDADGLNNLTRISGWSQKRNCGLVVTPHPGEFARLSGYAAAQIQADRNGAAMQFVDKYCGDLPLVCVLKGARTVVSDGERVYVNNTGNAGMASGGSGDVLTGVIAALIAQGMELFDAACLGVYLHGLAGDIAAEKFGQVSMIATDILDNLGAAFERMPK